MMTTQNYLTRPHLTRRKALQCGVCVPLFAALGACKQEAAPMLPPLEPGLFTERAVRMPKNKKKSMGYSAPKGRFDVHSLKHKRQPIVYHGYKARHIKKPPKSVLLLLHGSGRTGAAMIDMWSKLADRHNILLVGPDCAALYNKSVRLDPAQFLGAALTHAKAAYGSADDAVVYGFGHSAGAMLLTEVAARGTDLFERVAVHAGYVWPQGALDSPEYRGAKPALAHFLGDKDHIFDVESARVSAKMWANTGQDVKLVILKNHTHWYYDQAEFINRRAWAFLTASKK